jgi:pyridoxamine 5'-phosphate oxidase
MYETSTELNKIETDAWLFLLNGSLRSKDAFHTCVLGTHHSDGSGLRTVVLRKVLTKEKKLFIHTDIRSSKIQDIQNDERVVFLFYDAQQRLQFRLWGNAIIHHKDELSDSHWQKTGVSSRKCYLSQQPPGSVQSMPTDGLPNHLQGRVLPSIPESEAGADHFSVIEFKANKLDWLFLSSDGHRRALFVYNELGDIIVKNWINP